MVSEILDVPTLIAIFYCSQVTRIPEHAGDKSIYLMVLLILECYTIRMLSSPGVKNAIIFQQCDDFILHDRFIFYTVPLQ